MITGLTLLSDYYLRFNIHTNECEAFHRDHFQQYWNDRKACKSLICGNSFTQVQNTILFKYESLYPNTEDTKLRSCS